MPLDRLLANGNCEKSQVVTMMGDDVADGRYVLRHTIGVRAVEQERPGLRLHSTGPMMSRYAARAEERK